jgi:hydroxymethylbilane synthase
MTEPQTSNLEPQTLVMGTRGSALALAQSRMVARQLEALHPGLQVEERVIRTTGDQQQTASLPAIGGKGVFTLEIENALLNGEIDFAVHSLKDLPPLFPAGLQLAAVPKREAANDVLILHSKFAPIESTSDGAWQQILPPQARIGTSSLRRAAQMKFFRPDLQMENVRGNIDTRLRKLEEQNFDAILLARAGLNRLGLPAPITFDLDEEEFVPAPGQGALAIEARSDDARTLQMLAAIEDAATRLEIVAERFAMELLQAGCSTPLGARAVVDESDLTLWGVLLSPDGRQRLTGRVQSTLGADPHETAAVAGRELAAQLQAQGATELMTGSRSNI